MAKARKRTDNDGSAQSATAMADRPDGNDSPERPTEEISNRDGSERDDVRMNEDHREQVARRAYELYMSRGGSHGGDWDDWLAAERELTAGRSDEGRSGRGE